MDHSIFAQLLKVANKHEYRQTHEKRITRIDDAVQILGLEKVKRIALNTTILTLYKGVNLPIEFNLESLWLHSVGVAIASSTLAEDLDTGMQDQASHMRTSSRLGQGGQVQIRPKAVCLET